MFFFPKLPDRVRHFESEGTNHVFNDVQLLVGPTRWLAARLVYFNRVIKSCDAASSHHRTIKQTDSSV